MKKDHWLLNSGEEFTIEERKKIEEIFTKLSLVLRETCPQYFQIHLAYYATCKLKDCIVDSMKYNLEMIEQEKERREKLKDKK